MCVRKHIRELKGLQYAAPTSPQLGSSRHSEHTYTVLLSHNLHLDCRNFFGPDPPSSKTRLVGVMWRPRPADPVVLANDAASTLTLDAVDGLVVTPNANLFSTNSRISPRVNSCWVILAPVHIECSRNASIIIIPSMDVFTRLCQHFVCIFFSKFKVLCRPRLCWSIVPHAL